MILVVKLMFLRAPHDVGDNPAFKDIVTLLRQNIPLVLKTIMHSEKASFDLIDSPIQLQTCTSSAPSIRSNRTIIVGRLSAQLQTSQWLSRNECRLKFQLVDVTLRKTVGLSRRIREPVREIPAAICQSSARASRREVTFHSVVEREGNEVRLACGRETTKIYVQKRERLLSAWTPRQMIISLYQQGVQPRTLGCTRSKKTGR